MSRKFSIGRGLYRGPPESFKLKKELMLNPAESLLKEMRSKLSITEMIALEKEYHVAKKHPTLALALSWFLGWLAIDRFYIGDVKFALGKLLAILLCLITAVLVLPVGIAVLIWFVDLFKIMKATEARNIKTLESIYAKALMRKFRRSE